jgi:hypothetical protein
LNQRDTKSTRKLYLPPAGTMFTEATHPEAIPTTPGT